jgi:peptidoglycan-N-acetylglucosamine deacetylase
MASGEPPPTWVDGGPTWPDGRRAALSITFDDARPSQLDTGLPILAAHGLRATCYVLPGPVGERLADWRAAVAAGHEIGNHSLSHPCSGNFPFSRNNALEDYTPARIERDILAANAEVERLLGTSPASFAYPCGQRTVGRGGRARSYVPVVARHFVVGRGFRDEIPNDPDRCDLAQITGIEMDGAAPDTLRALVDEAVAAGAWLVLCAHGVGPPARQTVPADSLTALAAHARDRAGVLWTDTVAAIGTHLAARRAPARR